ncbi:hypothetical protein FBZ98_11264 [Rhizobium sp. ERR 922]|uniref:hypothetical protein n=1 Tax=unclassified Rhizobium TaxID=2613769 RepID=UPI0011A5DB64|nr:MULTISPECIES: hypothetical protein [unclassified Rhizobium]TWB46416.1 hypothetical protein FBZ98_11264 [Rhizobium sp. ERR 922]TWB88783.1 hypothetical protein FBZ97_11264 [Rhizobium sp. ERR 942]
MMARQITIAMALALATTNGHAAEPIEGNWRTAKGEPVAITKCGSAYCITAIGGKFPGKQIGQFSGKDGEYIGQLTDPADQAAVPQAACSLPPVRRDGATGDRGST